MGDIALNDRQQRVLPLQALVRDLEGLKTAPGLSDYWNAYAVDLSADPAQAALP